MEAERLPADRLNPHVRPLLHDEALVRAEEVGQEVSRRGHLALGGSRHTFASFDRLHDSHKSWILRSVLLPPRAMGILFGRLLIKTG